jgi:hypothetical protein
LHGDFLEEDPTMQRVLGTGSDWCLRPKQFVRIVCPEYFKRPDSEGTYIRVPIAKGFRLAGHEPEAFQAALFKGIEILEGVDQ